MTDHIAVRCCRCKITEFPERRADLRGWIFAYLPDGPVEQLVGAICPGCATDEDTAEVEIRAATEEITGSPLQLQVRPKDPT